jgi:hypothetical protein
MELCKCVLAAQRDHGNREVRANARMKYLVHTLGIDAFKALVESYLGKPLEPWRPMPAWKYSDWLGWHDQARTPGLLAPSPPLSCPCLCLCHSLSRVRGEASFDPLLPLCALPRAFFRPSSGRRELVRWGERGAGPHQGRGQRAREGVFQESGKPLWPRHGPHA